MDLDTFKLKEELEQMKSNIGFVTLLLDLAEIYVDTLTKHILKLKEK